MVLLKEFTIILNIIHNTHLNSEFHMRKYEQIVQNH